MALTILDLPAELVVRIASNLTTAELGPLRRCCKQVEDALFDNFAKEFFTKRQFMIEQESLEALLGIANHPGLASKLTEVIISTHGHERGHDLRVQRAVVGYVDQHVLLDTGLARDMLTDVFSKLPNLRTVGIRDYDGAGRDRDGPNARWRSWGWSLAPSAPLRSPDSLLPLVLLALGMAKAMPTNVQVFLRRMPHLSLGSFVLPTGLLSKNVVPVLQNLKTLMLAIGNPGTADLQLGAPWLPYDEKKAEDVALKRFLHHTSCLESLRLNFQPEQFIGARILEWLGRDPSTSAARPDLMLLPIPPVALNCLRSLELGMANVPGPALLRALTRFNLSTISLWKMILHCPGPNSVSRDCWSEFLDQFAKNLPASDRLRTVMIGHVSQCYFPGPHNWLDGPKVTFVSEFGLNDKAKAKQFDIVKFEAQFTAQSAKQWLQELSKRTFVPGIHTTPEPIESEAEESESDLGSDPGNGSDGGVNE